jgi:hypothetical protein
MSAEFPLMCREMAGLRKIPQKVQKSGLHLGLMFQFSGSEMARQRFLNSGHFGCILRPFDRGRLA